MSLKSWPGLAAIGAGLIHLGIAAAAEPLVLVAFALVGAAEAGWGVAALARTSPPLLRVAFGAAVLLVAGWVATLLAGGGGGHDHAGGATPGASGIGLPSGPMAGAGLLDLAAAVVLAVAVRRGSAARAEEPRPLRFLLGTAVGAGLVAVVTTTSLAGATAGAAHLH